MLAVLLCNLETRSADSVPAKQRKGKRPYGYEGPGGDELRALRERNRKDELVRNELAVQMQSAIERLRKLDVLPLQDATEKLLDRYTRVKVAPIRPELADKRRTYIDYHDLARSPLAQRELQRLLAWAEDEEDVLLLLLS